MSDSSPLPELPAIGFLSDLDATHRNFLASFGTFVRPSEGTELISEGKEQGSLYLILSGMLHVVAAGADRPLLIASLGAGDSIGEVNIFDPSVASASVYARSACVIWKITSGELQAFLDADPVAGVEFMKGLLQFAAHRIRRMNAKLAESEEKSGMHAFWNATQ